jgi:hypothetical protein
MVLVGVFRLDKLATNPDSGRRPPRDSNGENREVHPSDPNQTPWTNARGPAVTTSIN